MLTQLVWWLAGLWPCARLVDSDPPLDRALAFLGSDLDGQTVVAASYSVGLGLPLAATPMIVVGRGLIRVVGLTVVVLGLGVLAGGPHVPGLLASAKRSRALGATPALITRATLSMHITPAPERAARFAVQTARGPLARSLADHVQRAVGTPRSGLRRFAREWGRWFPAIERACSLVETAGTEPPAARTRTLERARTVTLDAARDQVADYATWLHGPATALYAFGVLVPLALVSLLPALGAAGVGVPVGAIALVYDVLLPVGVLCAGGWLVARRPVAFPPPVVDRSHPEAPDSRLPAVLAGLLAGCLAVVVATLLLPGWTRPIAGVGAASGTSLVVTCWPAKRVRDRIQAIEDGLGDALVLLGARVQRGEAVESALPAIADELTGPTGDVLAEAAARRRRLGVDVHAALLGRDGALAAIPSQRVWAAGSMLSIAAAEGAPAGDALVAMGEHLTDLDRIRLETRRSLEQVTRTLSNTAAVFGPLVGGTTVALADAMGSGHPFDGAHDVSTLGLVVGGYVLSLAVLLPALATGLARGFDRALLGYRIGLALLAATSTYLSAVVGTGSLV